MTREGPVLGIDLGTTFSAMAVVDANGVSTIIPNRDGGRTTPSIIHFYDTDACTVGQEVIRMVVVDPTNVARFVKRSMGEPDFTMEFFGRAYSPQELSAIILRRLKEDAEAALGQEIHDAVITVPAYFNSAQRAATKEAGAIAGLNVLSIVNEPTAAAIAYGLERRHEDRRFMVFDLGGGTFDVTVMEISKGNLRSLATDGNAELGGKDWDDRLLNHVAERFVERFGVDPRDDPQPYQELYERVLGAKLLLTAHHDVSIPVNYRGHRMTVPVHTEIFEDLCKDLVEQCSDTCGLVLEKAGCTWSDIDLVLAVGGSTRMPMIARMLTNLSGKAPVTDLDPDECIAVGAALVGVYRHRPHLVSSADHTSIPPDGRGTDNRLPNITITDIATHPLGVIVLDGSHRENVVILIPEGTPLPCQKRGRFAYAYDNMTTVRVEVTEGHGIRRDEVMVIGEVTLDHLPARPRGTPVSVAYRYTQNQILEVDIIDVETSASRRASIHLRGSLSTEQMLEAQSSLSRAQIG